MWMYRTFLPFVFSIWMFAIYVEKIVLFFIYPCFLFRCVSWQYFGKARSVFRRIQDCEMDLDTDQLVIVRTNVYKGWVFAESLDGSKGYVPYDYIQPILPSTEYVPQWKSVLSARCDQSSPTPADYKFNHDYSSIQRKIRKLSPTICSNMSPLYFPSKESQFLVLPRFVPLFLWIRMTRWTSTTTIVPLFSLSFYPS